MSAEVLGDLGGRPGAPTPRRGGVDALCLGPVQLLLLEALLPHDHAEGGVQAVLGLQHLPLAVQLGSCGLAADVAAMKTTKLRRCACCRCCCWW